MTSDDESESGSLASSESEAESSDPAFMDRTVESLATSRYDVAVATEPSIAPRQEPASARRPSLQTMAASLLRSKTFAGLTELMMVGDLRHVTRYLNDSRLKDRDTEPAERADPPTNGRVPSHIHSVRLPPTNTSAGTGRPPFGFSSPLAALRYSQSRRPTSSHHVRSRALVPGPDWSSAG